uniref:Chitobiosyldiphosphodolichol beta-mannosyltransferase n=2 Tax=Cacopsylla melanoneura TaxID=428564 RepID=A0A8D8PXL4_9HEMI
MTDISKKKNACIVVLGDIGRSPRMQYHALSLVKEGFQVDIVGYSGSTPISDLLESDSVHFQYLPLVPDFKNYLPNLLAFVFKVFFQAITLFWCLNARLTNIPHYLLVQNPPAIPSISICWLYCLLFNVKFIIDWHNYAYTILSLSLGQENMLVRLSRVYERYFGRFSKANLCVTRAMRSDLKENWNIEARTLHDRPPDRFRPTSRKEKHALFEKLSSDYPGLLDFVHLDEKDATYPGLVVSSTSWTEDEDFSILFKALTLYDADPNNTTRLVVMVTGKGPMKQYYLDQIREKTWVKIMIYTPWLSPEEYPMLIGCADLGVSLHTSSSGLDLPMKVVDMFGCGVPVCAKNFACLHELVRHGENGFVFDTEEELCEQLSQCFQDRSLRKKLADQVSVFRRQSWHENWKANAMPLFT